MVHKYKKIYQTQDETISENCVEWVGFNYKTANSCSGSVDISFSYVDCAGIEQTLTETTPCSNIAFSDHELLTPICVREASVQHIGGGANVLAINYGTSC